MVVAAVQRCYRSSMWYGPIHFLLDGAYENFWSGVLGLAFCTGSLLLAGVFFRRRLYPLGGAAVLLALGAWCSMGVLGQFIDV